MQAFEWRQEQFHNQMAWTAWHTAALMRQKKLPQLQKLMHSSKRRSRVQTVDEQIAMARMITAAFGGDSKECL